MNGHNDIPEETEEDIRARMERKAAELYEQYERENSRPKLATLSALAGSYNGYAMNEITGDLFAIDGKGGTRLVFSGTSAAGRCSLLFDKESVDKSWAPLCRAEAHHRIQRHGLV